MDIKWLEDFVCLCEHMNFSRASEKRHITQSAFSRRIKSLENWLGATLINRDAYPPYLTPEGEQFRITAVETLRNLNQVREQYHHGYNLENHIRVATQQTISTTFFPHWLIRIEQELGSITSQLSVERISDCVESFISGDVDMMILYRHHAIPFLLNEALYPSLLVGKERLIPVAQADENGQARFQFHNSNIASLPFLTYTSDSCFGQVVNQKIQQNSLIKDLTIRYENSFSHSLRVLVLQGYGFAWLPESSIRQELEQNVLARVGDEQWDLEFDVQLYYVRARASSLVQSIVDISDISTL